MSGILNLVSIPFGWAMWALYQVFKNYGLAIVFFTIITKLILVPISIKQQKNQAKTALFQPKLEKLKKMYGNNKEKYQEEMAKLYQAEGINPMASCGPMIIQLLLVIGIYDVVRKPLTHILRIPTDSINYIIEKSNKVTELEAFMQFKEDPGKFTELAADVADKLNEFDIMVFGLNFGAVPTLKSILVLIPILSGITALISSIVSQRINAKNNPAMDQAGNSMKIMMYTMPLMSVWIAFKVPVGLGFYWIISNIFIIGQTIILGILYNPEKLKAYAEAEVEKRRMQTGKIYTHAEEVEDDREDGKDVDKKLSKKELDKKRLAEARKRMAEKYGDD